MGHLFKIFTLVILSFNPINAAMTCSSTVNDLNFGQYDIYNLSNTDGISNFTITCTNNNGSRWGFAIINVYPSNGISGNSNNRYMSNNIDNLNYNLYTKSNLNRIFSINDKKRVFIILRRDRNSNNGIIKGTSRKSFYGSIPNSQMISSGLYSDNLNLIIEY